MPATAKKNDGVSSFGHENLVDPFPKGFPWHLPKLSMIKEMLIAPVHVVMKCYTLANGQTGYKGHITNYAQSIDAIVAATTLPWKIEEIPLIIAQQHNEKVPANLKHFKVSRSWLQAWLTYLKAEHPSYQHINIDWTGYEFGPRLDAAGKNTSCVVRETVYGTTTRQQRTEAGR